MKPFEEFHLFNCIFVAMGMVLLSVVIWIGANVAHIPAIEQKIDDFIISANTKLADHDARIGDHETRIRTLERTR